MPNISPLAEGGDFVGAKREARKALLYTAAISIPFAIALFAFAPLAARVIFPSLRDGEKQLLINLVRIMSINAVTSSVTAIIRVALSAALVAFTPLSIVGVAVSANCCYFVAVVLNFCYIIMVKNKKGNADANNVDRFGSKGRGFNPVG